MRPMRVLRVTIFALSICQLAVVAVAGQEWVVDVSAGSSEYEAVAGEVGSANAIVGLRRDAPTWLSFSAGVPLDSAGVPWASAGAGGRWSRLLGRAELGVAAMALGFGYRVSELETTGGGATLVGLPFVSFGRANARVELRTGVMHHTAFFDDERTSRTVQESGIDAALAIGHGASLGAEGRLVLASEGTYPYAGVSIQFARGPISAWARGGRWVAGTLDDGGWGLGGRVSLPARLSLRVAYERVPEDPLYWNGSRKAWTVGVSRSLGRRASLDAALPPPDVFQAPSGSVVMSLPANEVAGAPSVAGDFTQWEPVPMQLRDGVWEASFRLSPGVYHYSFLRVDGSWFLPESVRNRVDDGFGGVNGVLVVR
ncbi:MAG: hypothetical protein GEU90_07685 [Gemmatimonas sp.]|nr:hypothetical protein [Gemmatimonas sp.]